MAKHQTRRTVSLARPDYDKLTAFAEHHRVSASSLTEYALAVVMAGFDVEAFRAWRDRRDAESNERRWTNYDAAMQARWGKPESITDEMRVQWREAIRRRQIDRNSSSPGRRAALLVLDSGCSEADAARQIGITRQAVNQQVLKLRAERAALEASP